MGLLDDLKSATAVGLTHGEHYRRAFEKGVLLGPQKYGEASTLFDEAATRAGQAQDMALQARALANARLYGFLSTGRVEHLSSLAQVLPQLSDMEQIGSQSEVMPTEPLIAEVHARLCEAMLSQYNAQDHGALSQVHTQAATAFKAFFTAPLITYRFQAGDAHTETAQSRFFLHSGLASWHTALQLVHTSPEGAVEHLSKALSSFRSCNDAHWIQEAEVWLANCRATRTCWVCHREFQGIRIHGRTYPAAVTPYFTALVRSRGEDTSMADDQNGAIVLCNPCGTAMERQAEAYAGQVRVDLEAKLAAVYRELVELKQRVHIMAINR